MSSSSKDRGNTPRDDCQIHVDKEGESCVIKIESVGQEKMLKELLGRFNSLKSEVNQLVSGQQKQQQPKDIMNAIQDMTVKLKPLEEQVQKMNKNVGDDHAQINKKFDEIKHDLHTFKDQQKTFGSSKDTMDKILQKLDNLDKTLKNSHDSISTKNDFKPVLDAIQNLQHSFDKEKTKPDILARKLDAIDQKMKETQPEHLALMKDIQTKIEPLHKTTPQTSETLMKLNDRVKAMQADTTKPHPDLMQKLDNIDFQLKNQSNSLLEPIKRALDEKLNPYFEQTKKDGEQKLGSVDSNEKGSHSPSRIPLCINGMIPVSRNLSDPHVLQALAGDIAKKLADIQSKVSSNDDQKRKHDDSLVNLAKQQAPLVDEIKRLTPLIDKIKQQQQKDADNLNKELQKSLQPIAQQLNDLTKQQQPAADLSKELQKSLQPIAQQLNELTKQQQQPTADLNKELQKSLQPIVQQLNDLAKQQQQPTADLNKELSSKLDPLIQSIQQDRNQQKDNKDQTLKNLDKALEPISQMIKTLADDIQQQKQTDVKKIDNLEQRFSKTADETPKSSDIIGKLDEISNNLKQTDPTMKKLSDELNTIKNLIEKQPTPDDLLSKINELQQKQKAPLEAARSDSQLEPTHQTSSHKINNDMNNKIDKVNEQIQNLSNKIDEIQPKYDQDSPKRSIPDLIDAVKNLENQIADLKANLPDLTDFQKQIGSLKDVLDENNPNKDSSRENNDTNLDEIIKRSPDEVHSNRRPNSNKSMSNDDDHIAHLLTNLLNLQTTMQNAEHPPVEDIQQYLQRIERSPIVQNDQDLQTLLQKVKDLSMNQNNSVRTASNQQHAAAATAAAGEEKPNANKLSSLPNGYLTKSRYISLLSNQTIRDNWPRLSSKSAPIIESILNQPFEFDKGTNLDQLTRQNGLEKYSNLTKTAIEKSDKDYDQISYMMDSIVFDKMTMIGSREAMLRPWDPSLLNRASSKGLYPFPSGNGRRDERFRVDKDIALWMVETDENKPYSPTEFTPNVARANEKYERIQQPQFHEIRQNRREDETRWNERYAFTKDNRMILFVNDLRSYFMDYDTKRKYQVHDDVPINPVCRTGIAGRGDLPFWGPNHCVVVVLLRNINDPDVVLMKHHGDAFVLPKGFYGHEARYDNQIKIVQDPVSGQILPPKLFDYWWTNVSRLNEMNNSTSNLRRTLNEKELKEEFAEIFSQKGCNKSVFDNGYVDHPLNTDHAWVESSVWKIQFKEWRVPAMQTAKYAIAEELKSNNTFPFIWMKLTDALLVVPAFDRGILVDVLATGMPL